MTKEEIHWGLEMGIQQSEGNDGYVSYHAQHVTEKQKQENNNL